MNLNPPIWRLIQKDNFNNLAKLANFLELDDLQKKQLSTIQNFPLNVPLRLAQKMEKGSLKDPIFRQFVPIVDEELVNPNFTDDPLQEANKRPFLKLLHKYHGRVLLLTTSSCAMNCRYCFRRHFDYDHTSKDFTEELEYINNDPTIKEVILSGGDPLSLSNRFLKDLMGKIFTIPHITKIRFHTRFPIGIPERIDDEFIEILKSSPIQIIFVIHCNHPNELDDYFFSYTSKLQKLGVIVLNQAVLLKNVNDDLKTLFDLFTKLSDRGIIPYYLHQLDRVQGAAHFEVSEETGIRLIKELRSLLPGYAVPRYDREEPEQLSKTIIL